MAGYNGHANGPAPTSSVGALPVKPTRVDAIYKVCAATRELAKEMFSGLVGKPKSDGFYSAFSLLGFRPMSAIAELLTTEELGPVVKRWQSADVVIPTDYMAFVEACAKCGRLDHLEWLHGQTGSVELRLVLDVTILEWLVQAKK